MKKLTLIFTLLFTVIFSIPKVSYAATYACVLSTEAHVLSEGVNRFHPRYENFTQEKPVIVGYEFGKITFKGGDYYRIPMPKDEVKSQNGGIFVMRGPAPTVLRAFLDKETQGLDTLIYFFTNYDMITNTKKRYSVVQYWSCND